MSVRPKYSRNSFKAFLEAYVLTYKNVSLWILKNCHHFWWDSDRLTAFLSYYNYYVSSMIMNFVTIKQFYWKFIVNAHVKMYFDNLKYIDSTTITKTTNIEKSWLPFPFHFVLCIKCFPKNRVLFGNIQQYCYGRRIREGNVNMLNTARHVSSLSLKKLSIHEATYATFCQGMASLTWLFSKLFADESESGEKTVWNGYSTVFNSKALVFK